MLIHLVACAEPMNDLSEQFDLQAELAEADSTKRRRLLPKLRLVDIFWLTLLVAILVTWYQDRQKLIKELTGQTVNRSSSWSIDQLLGAPNTPRSGDCATAWAPRGTDAGLEWVIVEFPKAVDVAKIEIIETYNPGAVVSVSSISSIGLATEIWSGTDPVAPVAGMGTAVITPSVAIHSRRLKIELDTSLVSGWNEIDAVSIIDGDGNVQWASSAWGSSSYGENKKAPSWFWP